MALITCPDCQSSVSQFATACPSCGRPMQVAAWRPAPVPAHPFAAEKQNVQIAYGLYLGSYVLGPLVLVSLIMAYIKRNDVRGTFMEAHYNWIIDTFWVGFVAGLVMVPAVLFSLILFFPIAFLTVFMLVMVIFAWPIYRLVVGWTALGEGRSPYGKLSPPRW